MEVLPWDPFLQAQSIPPIQEEPYCLHTTYRVAGADTLGPTELRGLSVTSPEDLELGWGTRGEQSSELSLEVGKILKLVQIQKKINGKMNGQTAAWR